MKNIFRKVKFGDRFRTADGSEAIYSHRDDDTPGRFHMMIVKPHKGVSGLNFFGIYSYTASGECIAYESLNAVSKCDDGAADTESK